MCCLAHIVPLNIVVILLKMALEYARTLVISPHSLQAVSLVSLAFWRVFLKNCITIDCQISKRMTVTKLYH